ncbi:DUF4352 domain-containing protein [Alkalicoccobacillus gibsonii]|uniref:DUF4352 domain-containing protein n=1 Tax=Alkalicoccobacillus gibsonii TaxID=79881 RepID=UPI003F7BFC99
MKKLVNVAALFAATSVVLIACSNEESQPVNEENSTEQTSSDDSTLDEETETESEESALGEGRYEDQLDLRIGETGTVETTIGVYSVKVNKVEIVQELDGEMSELDYFVLVDYTLKNKGDEELDAAHSISNLEFTDDLEVSGFPNYAEYYETLSLVEGTLAPGEETTGQGLHDAYENDEYYLRVAGGLVASGAAKNDIRFTFQKNEME